MNIICQTYYVITKYSKYKEEQQTYVEKKIGTLKWAVIEFFFFLTIYVPTLFQVQRVLISNERHLSHFCALYDIRIII